MIASKLAVDPDTIRFKKLTPGKRAALRRQNIISLIESKPFGTPITLEEFAQATQSTTGAAYSLLKTMTKKGLITKDKQTDRRVAYSINGTPAVIKPAAPPVAQPLPAQQEHTKSLTEYAREFAWEHNSDSLRDFIQHMDGIELDMRRLAHDE